MTALGMTRARAKSRPTLRLLFGLLLQLLLPTLVPSNEGRPLFATALRADEQTRVSRGGMLEKFEAENPPHSPSTHFLSAVAHRRTLVVSETEALRSRHSVLFDFLAQRGASLTHVLKSDLASFEIASNAFDSVVLLGDVVVPSTKVPGPSPIAPVPPALAARARASNIDALQTPLAEALNDPFVKSGVSGRRLLHFFDSEWLLPPPTTTESHRSGSHPQEPLPPSIIAFVDVCTEITETSGPSEASEASEASEHSNASDRKFCHGHTSEDVGEFKCNARKKVTSSFFQELGVSFKDVSPICRGSAGDEGDAKSGRQFLGSTIHANPRHPSIFVSNAGGPQSDVNSAIATDLAVQSDPALAIPFAHIGSVNRSWSRALVVPSLTVCSNSHGRDDGVEGGAALSEHCERSLKWALHQSGVVSWSNLQHWRWNEGPQDLDRPFHYRIEDHLTLGIDLWDLAEIVSPLSPADAADPFEVQPVSPRFVWRPRLEPTLQFEYHMMVPYVRRALLPPENPLQSSPASVLAKMKQKQVLKQNTHVASFQAPYQHGIFKFILRQMGQKLREPPLTPIHLETLAPLRTHQHDEITRFHP